ncbi:hypothetical protein [Amycolatopsis sp. cmx-4-54]
MAEQIQQLDAIPATDDDRWNDKLVFLLDHPVCVVFLTFDRPG